MADIIISSRQLSKTSLALSKSTEIKKKVDLGLSSTESPAEVVDHHTPSNLIFPNMPKMWSRVEINLENSLLNEEKLNNPPSLGDGMASQLEKELRYLGCELIQSASILLKLPQVAAATGQILYQRFYYSKSFVRYNFEQTSMACVYLASKIEEAPRRMRDIINVFHHLKQLSRLRNRSSNKKPSPLAIDQRYVSIKNEVIKAERRVLKELGFCVHVKHPHKLIVSYIQALGGLEKRHLLQKAWNYMNDGLRSDVFLRYTPETIACACIHLASLNIGLPLPRADKSATAGIKMSPSATTAAAAAETTYDWWELFAPSNISVIEASRLLLKLYVRRRKPNWEKLDAEVSKLRQSLLEKQAANKISGGIENTPNPHLVSKAASSSAPAPVASNTKESASDHRRRDSKERDRKSSSRKSDRKVRHYRHANGSHAEDQRRHDTDEVRMLLNNSRRRRRHRSGSADSSDRDRDHHRSRSRRLHRK